MQQNKSLYIKSVEIGYKDPVLSHINAVAEQYDLIALIGENGAGKSTLLKSIARFIDTLSGEIEINGVNIKNYSQDDYSKLLSIVTTQRISISHLKVEELVAFGRFPHGKWISSLNKNDKEKVFQSIEEVHATHLIGKDISELSDGEYQRVMIARCLAQDTPIIILDEPTAFLDLKGKYEIVSLLQKLANNSEKIIIFSSHDLSLVLSFASKIWLINGNKFIEDSPEDLVLKDELQSIIQSNRINFNVNTGEIEPSFDIVSYIALNSEGKVEKWTGNALKKLGIAVTNDNTYPSITTMNDKKYYKWIFKLDNESQEIEFYSLKDLTLYMKRLTKNLKS